MISAEKPTIRGMPSASLLICLIGPGLLVAAAGAYPTWLLAGEQGLAAMAAAGVAVFLAMVGSAWAIFWRSGPGLDRLAIRFAGMAIFRMTICFALTAAAWYMFALPTSALLLWTGAFYLVMLGGECFWLARALKRRAKEFNSPK